MIELNCMFQYATRNKILADTGLITKECAEELFARNKDDFKKRLENDEEPEMAIWVNCKDNLDYGETLRHWNATDFITYNGELWVRVE